MTSTETAIRCASALSLQAEASAALEEVCAAAMEQLQGSPDLAVVFISPAYGAALAGVAEAIRSKTGAKRLIGCTGEAIVGVEREIESKPAISLWLATLPGYVVKTMHLSYVPGEEGDRFEGWPTDLPEKWPDRACLLLLGEPFTFPGDVLLARLNEDQPGVPVVGGMASGGWGVGENAIYCDSEIYRDGAVAAYLEGPVHVRTIVSQGCRPIGRPFVVTKAEGNIVYELSGKPALHRLQEVFQELPLPEQQMVRRNLHLGQVMNEYQEKFERGDFLIRNVLDADHLRGSLAIGDYVRVGRTVQFQVRDADTADEDLKALLDRSKSDARPVSGALLFTCNGRGTRLFPQPHHDAACIYESLGGVPLAGFFAQGEIGPVGGKNFLHGFTASLVLFGEA